MPGSHWVAFCFSDFRYDEYFDSYVLPPYKLEIMSYLQHHSIYWTFNHHRLQGLTSNVCGQYFCIYALHRARGLSMTSFVNMFSPARYTCNDTKAVRMFCAQLWEWPFATSWSISSSRAGLRYKKGTYIYNYQYIMSLLVINFTHLERKDCEHFKELEAVDSHSNRVSSYAFKWLAAGRNCHYLTLERMKLLTLGVIGMMVMYHIQT